MGKTRLEAFSDGVIAIIITIMVLELKTPEGGRLIDLLHILPVFLSYALSFIYVGIYWNNHHHMMQTCHKVTGSILWANLHLLFWMSLIPFATSWIGESHFDVLPVAFYGFILLMAALAYWILQQRIIATQGPTSLLKALLGRDVKGKLSSTLYLTAILLSCWNEWASIALYVLVAFMWFLPDQRIEKALRGHSTN
jgi:uncharacterized membrane protein